MISPTTTTSSRNPLWNRWLSRAGLAAVLLVAGLSASSTAPPEPRGADAAPEEFSAERAMGHIEEIAQGPRPVGSPAHAETRDHLVDQLDTWGWDTEVHESVGLASHADDTRHMAAVDNITATLPGSDPTGTVVLAAHYDSVSGSPGAADDGIGVGTILEVARALRADGAGQPRNDVMVLITDAEEKGLLGAEAFVRERAQEIEPAAVLNHEARGASGAPATFRMSSSDATLLEVLSQAPGVSADSAAEAVFDALPNDTDATNFFGSGLHGYDTAITGGGAFYHSPLDSTQHLSRASLQQMGRSSLAMARDLATTDLATLEEGEDQLITTPPGGPVLLPAAAETPLAFGLLALAGALVAVRWRRRELTAGRTALSAVAALLALAAAAGTALAVWQVALLVDPGQASAVVGAPYNPGFYQAAMLVAGVSVVLGTHALLRRRLGGPALAAGAVCTAAVAGLTGVLLLPGAATMLVLPVLPAATGALAAALLPRRWTTARTLLPVFALAPTALLAGPLVSSTFEVGLPMGGPFATLLTALFALLALPVVEDAWPAAAPRRPGVARAGVAALALALVAALTGAGLFTNREGATPARQEQLTYAFDADAGEAYWAGAPKTEWSESLLTEDPKPLDSVLPVSDGEPLAHGPAPTLDTAPPRVEVRDDTNGESGREVTLRVSSPREAPTLGLWVTDGNATVRSAEVAGRSVPVTRTNEQRFGFVFHGAAPEGVTVRLTLDQGAGDTATVRVADRTNDLTGIEGLAPPQDRELVRPALWVTRAQDL
ncbi:peptidase M28-like protein [Haloactinospora alba]|uniref:Peptidase M28-like protein n=1 Tax=Haloactinospora alba TaxID=405555 RepID=A0A543NL94_9ACTN|nr:M20/M25/M40 family metallo-hydrolase [Haloactinospora alba]TQN32574.1 peptidase M28-like protein [Haloactinospora alba]